MEERGRKTTIQKELEEGNRTVDRIIYQRPKKLSCQKKGPRCWFRFRFHFNLNVKGLGYAVASSHIPVLKHAIAGIVSRGRGFMLSIFC